MEITVASHSPLGQYLAELDDNDEESMAQGVSGPFHFGSRQHVRRDHWAQTLSNYNWMEMFQCIRHCIEVTALQQLLATLSVFHPTIQHDLQQTTSMDPAILATPAKWSWKRQIVVIQMLSILHVLGTVKRGRTLVVTTGFFMAVEAVLVARQGVQEIAVFHCWIVGITALMLLGLEISMQALLAWYRWQSGRLITSLNAFIAALKSYDKVFACSLTQIKRAELASRGYRLGTGLLPPIGRLETSNIENGDDDVSTESAATALVQNKLRCLPLRRRLRAMNEQLQIQTSIILKEREHTTRATIQDCKEEKATRSEQTPSLLLTVLTKQHNRAIVLLENAMHTVLLRNVTRACLNCGDILSWSLFRTLQLTVDQLIETLHLWVDDLKVWNSLDGPMVLLACASDTNSSDLEQKEKHVTSPNASGVHLQDVASQLHELRSTSETLTALVVAVQYELLSADSAVEGLVNFRDVMRSKIHQLHEVWGSYDSALRTLTGREVNFEGNSGNVANENEGNRDSEPITSLADPSPAASEDPNCTVIFTGTSTGAEGFDLQTLLTQQKKEDFAVTFAGSSPRFIRELQDVLAHRQAHVYPGLTKQVDHDQPMLLNRAAAALPPPCTPDAMFALTRVPRPLRPPSIQPRVHAHSEATASAFNVELQALLQQSQLLQRDVVEHQDDKNENAVTDVECGELVTTRSKTEDVHLSLTETTTDSMLMPSH